MTSSILVLCVGLYDYTVIVADKNTPSFEQVIVFSATNVQCIVTCMYI